MKPPLDHLKREILSAQQAECLAQMIQSGKHLFCGKPYKPAYPLLPNTSNRPYRSAWRPE